MSWCTLNPERTTQFNSVWLTSTFLGIGKINISKNEVREETDIKSASPRRFDIMELNGIGIWPYGRVA